MATNQASITDYAPDQPTTTGPIPDDELPNEWGPDAHTPAPTDDLLDNGMDVRRLLKYGVAPSNYNIMNGVCSPITAKRMGFHPDDRHRPDRWQSEVETPGVEEALATQHEFQDASASEDSADNGKNETDGLASAVDDWFSE